MICATGDLHGNALRFQPEYFPEQAEMTKEDYMIVCGECGKLYRRKTRNIKGNIYHEWRCISRLDYGKRY